MFWIIPECFALNYYTYHLQKVLGEYFVDVEGLYFK